MPLIECPECGREVSSSAAACPSCAYPVGARTPATPIRAASALPKHQWWKTALSIVFRVGLGGMLAAIGGGEEESAAAVIGGLIIGASAIPVFYRDTIERLKAGRASAVLDGRIEDRMAEIERRYQEQMVRLQETHSGQIAELEERLDFAERLLTKDRGPVQ